jgi:hypothetical protein
LNIPAGAERKIDYFFKKGFKQLEGVDGNAAAIHALKGYTEALIGRQS